MRHIKKLVLATLCIALLLATGISAHAAWDGGVSVFEQGQVFTESNGDGLTAFNLYWDEEKPYIIHFEMQNQYPENENHGYYFYIYKDGKYLLGSSLSNAGTKYAIDLNAYYYSDFFKTHGDGEYIFMVFTAEEVMEGASSTVGDTVSPVAKSAPLVVGAPKVETPSAWAVDQINEAVANNLVPKSLQEKYTQATTRAEFCALAVAMYESVTGKEITERSTFSDTTDINVEKAAAIGVVAGVGNNKFDPNSQLTREQAAVMIARLAAAVEKPLANAASTFADNDKISTWATAQVGQIQAAGIMGGIGENTFAPKQAYTREQSIVTILRLFNKVK